jgi:uncharacterized membrane protein
MARFSATQEAAKFQDDRHWRLPPKWSRFLIVILLILGVFFRFVNLDRKVYWHDEVYTSLRLSGYTEAELVQQVVNGREIGVEDLQKYQRVNSEKRLIDTVKGLAVEEPQLPPLYYVLARFWVQWFGNSVAVTRSLSALISLLVFPCLYWLCLELFASPLVGWVAVALMAVSPFHVLYAQEARPYSLWTVTVLLSSAALLRAMRLTTKLNWAMYAATVALGLYTFFFSVLIAISHGIYVVATERLRWSKTVKSYVIASIAGFLAFLPWILVVIANFSATESTTAWVTEKLSLARIVTSWFRALSTIFIDFWNVVYFFPDLDLPDLRFAKYLGFPVLILIGYSFYFLYRNAPKRIWLFILTLVGVTALALMLPDLIVGGRRSHTYRYLVPCYLGIQLTVAYLFAHQISGFSRKIWQQKTWQIIMLVLISGGILSCAISSQAQAWWNKYTEQNNPQTARIINQAPHPLLVSDSSIGYVISLSYFLDAKVRLLLLPEVRKIESTLPRIPDNFSDVFLFESPARFRVLRTPANKLRYQLAKKQHYKIKPAYEMGGLWRIK